MLFRSSAGAQGLLLLAVGAELALFTGWRNAWGPFVSPILFAAAGLLVAALAWQVRAVPAGPAQQPVRVPRVGLRRLTWGLIAAAAVGWLWWEAGYLRHLFDARPTTIGTSDIILALRVYVRRWRWAEIVYRDLTPAIGYYLPAGYLPGTWFPFVAADVLGVDYRWLALGVLLMGIAAYWAHLAGAGHGAAATILLALLPLAGLTTVRQHDPSSLGLTVEPLHVGYYLLLGAALLTRSVPLRAAALALCLLSRYSLALWLPLYGALVWWHEGPRRALALAGLVAALVVGGYVWPFLRHDWTWLPRTMAYYKVSAVGEWRHFEGGPRPHHLFNGLGLAPYFYPRTAPPGVALPDAQLLHAITRIQRAQLLALGGLVLVLAGWWWGQANRRGRAPVTAPLPAADGAERFFALVSLKLYLVVFYATVQIPYAYLVLVSVFFSVLLVGLAGRRPPAAPVAVPTA